MEQKDQENLLENTLTFRDEEREPTQLTCFLPDKFPSDILRFIFSFLDAHTLLKVILVNKEWNTIAAPWLPRQLFNYYHNPIPQAFNDGHLLSALCKAVKEPVVGDDGNRIDLFSSEIQQKRFFQQFMQDVFDEVIDGSELLIDFLTRMSQMFRQFGEQNERNRADYEARFAYLDVELTHAQAHIHFLFQRIHIEQLVRLYDRKEKCVIEGATSDDYLFLAQCLQRAARLEGFLTTLVLFWKLKKRTAHDPSPGKIITSQRWTSGLLGDGLTALHTISAALLSNVFNALTSQQTERYSPYTLEEAQFLFQKLRPIDILTWVKILCGKSNFYEIKDLLLVRLPYFLHLLATGSLASDTALIYCLKQALNSVSHEFFNELVKIPEVMIRLQTPIFLQRLFTASLFSHEEKGRLASSLLHRPVLMAPLPESILLDLLCYLQFANRDNSYALDGIFALVLEANRLTSTLLIKLAQFGPPADRGKYALSILKAESVRVLLIQDTNCVTDIAKIAINSRYKENIISQLEKWFDLDKGEHTEDTKRFRLLSVHWQVLCQGLADEDLAEMTRFFSLENFFIFLDRIFSIDRMTYPLFSVFIKTFPDKSWWEQDSLIHFNLKTIFTFYLLSVVDRFDRRQWLSQNIDVAFAFTQCVFASDKELGNFVSVFSEVIAQFSPLQWAELYCTANPQHQPMVLGFFTLNRWLALWTELHRVVDIYPPNLLKHQPFFEAQLIDQLTHETSAKTLIDCLFEHQVMDQIQSWCSTYPAFLQRLQQPNLYSYVWQRCMALLTNSFDGELPPNIFSLLALVAFLPSPEAFDICQQQTLLKSYTASQLYTFCLQLGQKSGGLAKTLQTIFYPACLPLLGISDLRQLKQQLSTHWLIPLLFPIDAIEQTLAKKVQQDRANDKQASWLDTFTTRELTASLLLLLVGVSCFIAGLALGWIMLTGIGVIPLLLGVGILVIPFVSTLGYRQILPETAQDKLTRIDGEDLPRTSFAVVPPTPTFSLSSQSSVLSTSKPLPQEGSDQKPALSSSELEYCKH